MLSQIYEIGKISSFGQTIYELHIIKRANAPGKK